MASHRPSALRRLPCGNTSAAESVVTRLASRNSARDNSVQIFPRRHAQRERQQIAGAAHVEGVFRETADVALHDHQILGGVGRGLGIIGTIAHPDLMNADMRRRRHVPGLAGKQQEHAHQLAVGFRHHACAFALLPHGSANGRQRTQAAKAAPQRYGIVDRAAAGIQHDGCAAELAIPGELVERLGAIRRDDADGRDPALAVRLATNPRELHRLLAFLEGAAGICRIAQRRDCTGQCETEGGRAEERPAAKFQRRH